MNLPNDVARCHGISLAGESVWQCPHRNACERHAQINRDREAYTRVDMGSNIIIGGVSTYVGTVRTFYPTITNCLVDGEYTALIKTED